MAKKKTAPKKKNPAQKIMEVEGKPITAENVKAGGPNKSCPKCGTVQHVRRRKCENPNCDHVFPIKVKKGKPFVNKPQRQPRQAAVKVGGSAIVNLITAVKSIGIADALAIIEAMR